MKRLLVIFLLVAGGSSAFSETPIEASDSEIYKAYQREILFLNSYKSELKLKLKQVSNERTKRLAQAKDEIQQLQKKLVSMDVKSESLDRKLANLEREQESSKEVADQIDLIVSQFSSLKGLSTEASSGAKGLAQKIGEVISTSIIALNQAGKISIANEEYYNEKGERHMGDVAQLGLVAKFAVDNQLSGPLFPVGQQKFKVWESGSKETITALTARHWPELLPVFLFESAETGFVPKKEKSIYEVVASGGTIAWVIVILGALALVLSAWRYVLLKNAQPKNVDEQLEQVLVKLRGGQSAEAQAVCAEHRNAISRVMAAVILHLKVRTEKVQDVIDEKILEESQIIDKFGQFILVLAAIAPLLGLLGTVTGMISTFDTITEYGTGNPRLLSGGISEALVTTMLGLVVAIPALMAGNFLNSWNKKLKDDMERSSLAVCNSFVNEGNA